MTDNKCSVCCRRLCFPLITLIRRLTKLSCLCQSEHFICSSASSVCRAAADVDVKVRICHQTSVCCGRCQTSRARDGHRHHSPSHCVCHCVCVCVSDMVVHKHSVSLTHLTRCCHISVFERTTHREFRIMYSDRFHFGFWMNFQCNS